MSIIKITQDDIESFTIATNPSRTYISSSAGSTGSVHVFARRSSYEKELPQTSAFIDATHNEIDTNESLRRAQNVGTNVVFAASSGSFYSSIDAYMNSVNAAAESTRKQKVLEIVRFTPTYTFTSNTVKKLMVKDILMPYYRTSYPTAHWAYTNYNSLNFFTASTVNPGAALLYPNVDTNPDVHTGYVSGAYSLSGAFSFDFYINPRYQTHTYDAPFKAGTIVHLSSSYAVSLVTGSLKDENGKPAGFRIKLQLSHSADITPSLATLGTYPNDLIFMSDDNSLRWNRWHHVIIRWGTNLVNAGTGSFNIDGVDKGKFFIPSGTIAPLLFTSKGQPDVLTVGNFYEGTNTGNNAQALFFSSNVSTRDGVESLVTSTLNEPTTYTFNHPLNAELHDVSIKRYYMSDDDIAATGSSGPRSLSDGRTALYIPPFFVETSPIRKYVDTYGGILQTPFFEIDGQTDDPINVAMSFGAGGHYVNVENYVKDFANGTYPRVHQLTGSAISYTTSARAANEFLYDDPFVRRRNLLILPCDDGLFEPGFELLMSESLRTKMMGDDGVENPRYVNIDNLLSTSSLIFGTTFVVNEVSASSVDTFIDETIGFSPETPGIAPGPAYLHHKKLVNAAIASGTLDAGVQQGAPLTVYQRTLDPSSNQVTFFDVSNLYYGMRIHPGSLTLSDWAITGSSGRITLTLKDDGRGNLYRADCLTSASMWNSVGNVFYDEGIIVLKSPHVYFFGKEQFEISFKGEQNIHSMKVEVIAAQNTLNSSSNPSFVDIHASGRLTDTDPHFVYVTGINFHDKDFNVVMKSSLAQPIMKRHGARLLFKAGIDF